MINQTASGTIKVRVGELPPIRADDSPSISVKIIYPCSRCERRLKIRSDYFGRPLACKHCSHVFRPSLIQALSGTMTRDDGKRREDPTHTTPRRVDSA